MPRLPRLRKGAAPAPQAQAPPEAPAATPAAPPPAPEAATTVMPAAPAEPAPAASETPAATSDAAPAASETPAATSAAAPAASETPADGATAEAPSSSEGATAQAAPAYAAPGFRERARIRRRLRHLRRYRELAFRDLGGLMFDLHRFGRERNDLVTQKLDALGGVDRELRALETALRERREVTELREAGIAACPRCGALHGTDANFCPGCGTALRGTVVRDAAPVTVAPADPPQQPAAS